MILIRGYAVDSKFREYLSAPRKVPVSVSFSVLSSGTPACQSFTP